MELFTGKCVAIIGAGLLQVPVIKAAQKMGLKAAVVDMNPKAPGVSVADFFVNASTMDAESACAMLEKFHLETHPIHGVLTVGTDASYTVAVCAEKLGLVGIEPEAAINATDKYAMRKALRQAKVPVPDFEMVDTYQKAVEVLERMGSDCVIKPVKNMGARGVRRIFNLDDLKEGFEQAIHHSKSGKVIIEQYIDASELSIDALVHDGNITITGVADRIIEYDPYFVETGHIMPSQLPEDLVNFAVETFKNGIRALGITVGAAKGDIKISHSGCYIGEIAARLSGGFMSTFTFPYSSGIDLMSNMVRVALGLAPTELMPTKNWTSIERAVIAGPGIINSIDGLENSKKLPYVNDVFFDSQVGDKIKAPQNNLDKSGHIIAAAPTYHEALLASHEAVKSIRIKTTEDDDQLIPENLLNDKARTRFNGKCSVCPDCDGIKCKGWMPGVGGIGTGSGFINSVNRIRGIEIIPSYINDAKYIDTGLDFLGRRLDFPILPGPITGSITNLGGAISELDLARAIVKGAYQAGSLGFVGDGATPTKFRIGIKVVLENFGHAVPIFKPRFDSAMILERIAAAQEAGAMAVGLDIDAASFATMEMKGQNTSTKTLAELKELVDAAGIPFILKGILSPADAENALKAGVKVLIVSNHGGRVSDSLIAPIDALSGIRKAVGKDAILVFDGGVRSGGDAFKALCLGADLVMIGRPVMIAAVGGGVQGVRQYLNKVGNELRKAMAYTGVKAISEIKGNEKLLYMRKG